MQGIATAAYLVAILLLIAGSVGFRRIRHPSARAARAARRLGFAVHIAAQLGIAAVLVEALLALVTTRSAWPLLGATLGGPAIWWLSGGIAMRFGVRRDELLWWLP
jgi:hypothetical protein